MVKLTKLSMLMILLSISVNTQAKPYYVEGTFEDVMGKYDNPGIEKLVDEANKACITLFEGDLIVEHWFYNPARDEVYLSGRTRSWFFYKKASCSYRPSNKSATGGKYPAGLNILGVYESVEETPKKNSGSRMIP